MIFEILPASDTVVHIMPETLRTDAQIDAYIKIAGFVGVRSVLATRPPEHVPIDIAAAFEEAATCLQVECFNAAAAMFRLCIDLATRGMLPPDGEPNGKIRRSLGLRLEWLFTSNRLPEALRDLSEAVKDDGNDGAHAGSLTRTEAADLLDFTSLLLERLYTEPARLRIAKERRAARHQA